MVVINFYRSLRNQIEILQRFTDLACTWNSVQFLNLSDVDHHIERTVILVNPCKYDKI